MMLSAVLPPTVAKGKFNYFDIVVFVWLIIGLFRGRKRGMSQEVLPLFQWIAIVVAGGFLWWSLAPLIHSYVKFDWLWSNVTAYLVIALGIHLIYMWMKQLFGEKLVEKDPFGRGEYYLGMMSGIVRFACMMLFALSLMNSHVVSAEERAKTEKMQADNFSDIRLPTYGSFQQDVLFNSFTGNFLQSNLKSIMITSTDTGPPKKKGETMAQKSQAEIDEIIGNKK